MWKEQCKFWINAGCLCKTTRRVVSSILSSSSENFSELSGVWILLLLWYSVYEQARAIPLRRHSGEFERRAQGLWNLQNICVRYNYQMALLCYFFESFFRRRTRIFIPCHQGNSFSSRLSTLVRCRIPDKANKTVLPLALVGSEMIMANSAISTVLYLIRTRKELLNRYT